MVVASYYVLFAVMGGTVQALILESSVMTVFIVSAIVGFRFNQWIVVAALVGHGICDCFHGFVITNDGMPQWWPAFCGAYDVCAGGCLAWLLTRAKADPLTDF